jgi:acyl transferase domain-containing protein/acyl carrier protein
MQPGDNPLNTLSPLKRALLAVEQMQARVAEVELSRREPIAIVGIGCRFPGAANPAAFWRLLQSAGDAIDEVPESRWFLNDYFSADVDAPGKMMTRWGGFLDQVDQFDAEFFGISPREAALMDPQQRLLLEVAWEALENGAQGPANWVNGKTGVFIGITGDEYAQRIFRSGDLTLLSAWFASGIARSVAGGRISYTLGMEGPNFSIDTACSSSLVAVHNACVYLRTGQCRMALAGGVNVILSPEIGIAFSKAHMMAANGRCKAFDARADGFVRAEGCGLVVLKRLSDALTDGDRILALIRGSAINQDGRSSGLTVPNVNAQESVIREALAPAGVDPGQIGYIEAHGTGTALGDPIEARALARVFAPGRSADQPLVVGSVKTNVGHLEAAAGIAGLIKAVLAFHHEEIPANLHFHEMNPHIDWGGLPVEIPARNREWRRGKTPRLAGVSAFGFSGTNAHVVLEEAPAPAARITPCERPLHLLALSARTDSALCNLTNSYTQVLSGNEAAAADICFSANCGRSHFAHRIAVTGESAEELRSKLLESPTGAQVVARDGVTPVFLFPGQGAQYAGMGKELYDAHPEFRHSLDRCAELLESELPTPLTDVLWGSATHLLDQTAYTQPALFAIEYALAELWRSWGIEPAALLGHSIGEYVAACIAGVYSLASGVKLIAARARLMQGVGGSGAMTAVLAPEDRVRDALRGLDDRISIAALNAPENSVISGYADALEVAESRLRRQSVRVQRLAVSHAFHSPQMDEIADRFAAIAAGLSFGPPRIKWVSSMTGQLMGRSDAADPSYWRRQVREPVRFRAAMETLHHLGNFVFLEVGPGTTLSALGRQSISGSDRLWLPSLGKGDGEWQRLLDSVSRLYKHGAEVGWTAFDRPYDRRRVELPTYPFERQRYWFENPQPAGPVAPFPKAEPALALATNPRRDSLFEVVWETVERRKPQLRIAGDWLIVADRTGVGPELAARLSAIGGDVSLMQPADNIKTAASAKAWKNVVFLRGLDAPLSAELTPESLENVQRDLCCSILDLLRGMSAASSASPPRLWLITQCGQAVGDDRSVAVAQSTLWGIAQSIGEEHPEWNCTCVDLDAGTAEASAADLCEELLANDSEDHIALRDSQRLAMRIVPVPASHSARNSPAICVSEDATYIITGGFGALGQRVARWIIERGARTVVLTGRSAPSAAAGELIECAEFHGARIIPYRADVSQCAQVERMLAEIAATLPPLRGVVHAAGVLDDGVLGEQTWERFDRVFAAKLLGSWNLHLVTATVPLDFFVLFSSVAAVIGAPGQSNYAAANAFQDSLAHYRRRCGLPGTSIAWGAWSEGMAARGALGKRRELLGVHTMAVDDALRLFGQIMDYQPEHVLAGAFDWTRFTARYQPRPIPGRFRRLVSAPSVGAVRLAEPDLMRQLTGLSQPAGAAILRDYLRGLTIRVLGFAPGREIDPAQPLQELGLDSLMAVELRNALSAALRQNLPATLLFSYPALDDVTQFLAGLLWGTSPQAVQPPASNTDEILDRLEHLSDEQLDHLISTKFGTPQ